MVTKPLKILFVSAECAPFAKTGGLADVAGSLPKALATLGHEVLVVLPFYRQVSEGGYGKAPKTGLQLPAFVPESGIARGYGIRREQLPGAAIPVLLIEQPEYFDRPHFYGDERGDYADNLDRFAFFAHAALAAALDQGFRPDVIHCHDWHTAMIPAYLRTVWSAEPALQATGTLFTIHNLAYQGLFPDHLFGRLGLPGWMFQTEGIEFYGQVNFMKAGLCYSDILNTVSPRYAEEIQTPEFGCGLDGVLRARKDDLYGIINGLDYSEWSPENDPYLSRRYSKDSLEVKQKLKEELVTELGMEYDENAPLLAVISRLDSMKGLNLLEEITDYLIHMNLRLVLLGTGEARYMESFRRLAQTYPERAAVRLEFDNALAHRIEAAADIFLMPSRFEPCGLNQLISLRYGTVPVVRAVGGLADTVKEFDARTGTGNGFTFHDFSSMGLFNAIKRALELYKNRPLWRRLQLNGMEQDHSWASSAGKYVELYKKILEGKRIG